MGELRPYQADLVNRLSQSWRAGHKAPCIVLPCGGGKSVIVAEPGETKSGTFGAVNQPIRAWQNEKRADYEKSRNLYLQEKQLKEEKRANLRKALASLTTDPQKKQQYHEELKQSQTNSLKCKHRFPLILLCQTPRWKLLQIS